MDVVFTNGGEKAMRGLRITGKSFCKGIRVPDEKLKPLAGLTGNFYIGRERVNGKESYGYSRKPDEGKKQTG